MLASWRGTRFEVMQVLREVCDKVLKDHTVSENTLILRAKVCNSALPMHHLLTTWTRL